MADDGIDWDALLDSLPLGDSAIQLPDGTWVVGHKEQREPE